ncbi:MAG: hypothetical protein ABW276_01900, partial [Casimicrobiaceae bacterium]
GLAGGETLRHEINQTDAIVAQRSAVERFFDRLGESDERLVYAAQAGAIRTLPGSLRPGRTEGSTWVGEALAA